MNGLRAGRWLASAGIALAVLALVAAAPDEAQQSNEEQAVPAEGAEDVMVQLGSLRVAVDPETGDLRPLSRQEAAHLANEMRKRFKPRDLDEPTLRPDGSMSAVVAPNVLRFSVARIGEDGSVALDCAENDEAAIELLTQERENASAGASARPVK